MRVSIFNVTLVCSAYLDMRAHDMTQLDLLTLLLQSLPFLKSLDPHDFNVFVWVGSLAVTVSAVLVRALMNWLKNQFASLESNNAKLESRIDSNNAKLESNIAKLESRLESNIAKLESKFDQLTAEVRNDHRRVTDRFVFLNSLITVGTIFTSWRLLGGS